MSKYTPNPEINDYITILSIEKTGQITSGEVEYHIDIGGDANYGSVDLCDEEFEVRADFDVADVADMSTEDIDNLFDALFKYHPELMSQRTGLTGPTNDAQAIKILMERLDEINAKHAAIGAELAAIRRAAGMLTVATPADEHPVNK
tara:strand:+ start:533 stop:973 length:441 start_codon:yes stop_codon:yes gene_type:complete